MVDYWPRMLNTTLPEWLGALGGVVLKGPCGSGKTATAGFHARSAVRLDWNPDLLQLAQLTPAAIPEVDTSRVIDEWQLAPTLWNAARHLID